MSWQSILFQQALKGTGKVVGGTMEQLAASQGVAPSQLAAQAREGATGARQQDYDIGQFSRQIKDIGGSLEQLNRSFINAAKGLATTTQENLTMMKIAMRNAGSDPNSTFNAARATQSTMATAFYGGMNRGQYMQNIDALSTSGALGIGGRGTSGAGMSIQGYNQSFTSAGGASGGFGTRVDQYGMASAAMMNSMAQRGAMGINGREINTTLGAVNMAAQRTGNAMLHSVAPGAYAQLEQSAMSGMAQSNPAMMAAYSLARPGLVNQNATDLARAQEEVKSLKDRLSKTTDQGQKDKLTESLSVQQDQVLKLTERGNILNSKSAGPMGAQAVMESGNQSAQGQMVVAALQSRMKGQDIYADTNRSLIARQQVGAMFGMSQMQVSAIALTERERPKVEEAQRQADEYKKTAFDRTNVRRSKADVEGEAYNEMVSAQVDGSKFQRFTKEANGDENKLHSLLAQDKEFEDAAYYRARTLARNHGSASAVASEMGAKNLAIFGGDANAAVSYMTLFDEKKKRSDAEDGGDYGWFTGGGKKGPARSDRAQENLIATWSPVIDKSFAPGATVGSVRKEALAAATQSGQTKTWKNSLDDQLRAIEKDTTLDEKTKLDRARGVIQQGTGEGFKNVKIASGEGNYEFGSTRDEAYKASEDATNPLQKSQESAVELDNSFKILGRSANEAALYLGNLRGVVAGANNRLGPQGGSPRAFGGSVFGGLTNIVGERGSEVFVPKTDGTIISNKDMHEGIASKFTSSLASINQAFTNAVRTTRNGGSSGGGAGGATGGGGDSVNVGGDGDYFGKVAATFESGGDPGAVSSGKGDAGGKSFGAFQLSSKTGSLEAFLNKTGYGKQFEGMDLKNPGKEVEAKWKQLASDPEFIKAQSQYAKEKYFDPHMAMLKKNGIDLSGKGRAVDELVLSTANQYGANSSVLMNAFKGKNVSQMEPEEIIRLAQEYKAGSTGSYFASSSEAVRAGVRNRIAKEQQMLLGMTKRAEGGALDVNQPSLVGEKGPEMFVPNTGGSVVPASKTKELLEGKDGDGSASKEVSGKIIVEFVADGQKVGETELKFNGPDQRISINPRRKH